MSRREGPSHSLSLSLPLSLSTYTVRHKQLNFTARRIVLANSGAVRLRDTPSPARTLPVCLSDRHVTSNVTSNQPFPHLHHSMDLSLYNQGSALNCMHSALKKLYNNTC